MTRIIFCLTHNKEVSNTIEYARMKHKTCQLEERFTCPICDRELNETTRKEVK